MADIEAKAPQQENLSLKNNIYFGRNTTALGLLLASLLLSPMAAGQNVLTAEANETPHLADSGQRTGRTTFHFEGYVLEQGGALAEGAVVLSGVGGQAVSGPDGRFRLEVQVPREATSIQITAIGQSGSSLIASRQVALSASSPLVSVGGLQLAQGTGCSASWLPTFGGDPGVDEEVYALAVFDDGSGPALYVGGEFNAAGGVAASGIAKWDGTSWSALGSGVTAPIGAFQFGVRSLAVFDDGGGAALYAGGPFSDMGGITVNGIAKWDGTHWSALGSGVPQGGFEVSVLAMAVFDDGTGDALFVGGGFDEIGGVAARRVAKWDGSAWSALSMGVNGTVYAMTTWDDGGGTGLYLGGWFTFADLMPARRIVKWDGTGWTALANGTNGTVYSLTTFDDGGGSDLYVGGTFTIASGQSASKIARWNGTSWSSLGFGMTSTVRGLTSHDDGSGPALYAVGQFLQASGMQAFYVARWNGLSWSTLNTGLAGSSNALTVFDSGNGPALIAGGGFGAASGRVMTNVAAWDGSSWTPLGDDGVSGAIFSLAVFDDGTGPALYASGFIDYAGGTPVNSIAKWDGGNWTALGSGLDNAAYDLLAFDDGNGDALYAIGIFQNAGGMPANRIAKWDGTNWSALGSGLDSTGFNEHWNLAVFDDGGGEALYAGGSFTGAGGMTINSIAKWNGVSWSALGGGVTGRVQAMYPHDDGSGPALYVGGSFTVPGVVTDTALAKWDGTNWSASPGGVFGGLVKDFTLFDDGTGPALIVGGSFSSVGGVSAMNIAKWDGSIWSPLGAGLEGSVFGGVFFGPRDLVVYNDGNGDALYAGGHFTSAGGVATTQVAKWDGSGWSSLGSGVIGPVLGLATYDDGTGDALYVGGGIGSVIDSQDSNLGKWGCAGAAGNGNAYCLGDGSGNACPCGASGSGGQGCLNTSGISGVRLAASGLSSLSNDSFALQVSGAPGNKPGLLLRGANQINGGLGNPVGDGLLCTNGQTARSQVQTTRAGVTTFAHFKGTPFGTTSYGTGTPTNYQFWYRDASNTCSGSGFNFSNAWTVTWQP